MFFENEMISFNILDVLKINQKTIKMYNNKRNFNALSFRIKADTILKTNTEKYYIKDHYVSFVPAGLDYTRVSKIDELIAIHFEATNSNDRDIEFFKTENPIVLEELFIRIFDCWSSKKVGYKYRCSAIFNEILALCYVENYKPDHTHSKIQKSVEYLLKHYNVPNLSMGEIAAKSYISEVYFRKIFKDEYGISPKKYIINLRIQYARKLISMGYYSIKEIALMSGYTDSKYFSIDFKKQVGISPSAYLYQ